MATKRLINANALAENWFYTNDTGTKVVELLEIEQAPTVDAVEVVRCKDCWNCTKSMWCNLLMMSVEANDFCSHGKRRKDNDSF